MKNFLMAALVAVVLISGGSQSAGPRLPDVKTSYVEYCFDYTDPETDITYYGFHHIRFSDLNGSLIEILD